jgi:hypothetical protein
MQLRRLHLTRCADGKVTERAELRDNSRAIERARRKYHENLVRKYHLPLLSRSLDRVSSGRGSRSGGGTRRRLLYCPPLRTRLLPGLRHRLHIRPRTVLNACPSAQVVSQIPGRARRSCTLSASAMDFGIYLRLHQGWPVSPSGRLQSQGHLRICGSDYIASSVQFYTVNPLSIR